MANYEHLPIFKKLMELSVLMEQVVQHFSRYHKYTLGNSQQIVYQGNDRELGHPVVGAGFQPRRSMWQSPIFPCRGWKPLLQVQAVLVD